MLKKAVFGLFLWSTVELWTKIGMRFLSLWA